MIAKWEGPLVGLVENDMMLRVRYSTVQTVAGNILLGLGDLVRQCFNHHQSIREKQFPPTNTVVLRFVNYDTKLIKKNKKDSAPVWKKKIEG